MSKKQTKFVLLLDYTGGTLIKIKLTEEEQEKSLEYEDFEDFLHTLEISMNSACVTVSG